MAKYKNPGERSRLFEISRDRKLHLIVFAFSFLLYANTIPNKYNLDDELVTSVDSKRKHPLTFKGIKAIPEIFTKPYYSDDMGYAYDFRPVVLTSFAIEHSVFGDNPHISHFFNVLLYSFACILLLLVLNNLLTGFNPLIPILTTLLFAAYPLHTEVVASIKNRDEILSLMGGLGALYHFLIYVDRGKKLSLLYASICFALGLLSKQTALGFIIITPVLLALFRKPSLMQLLIVSLLLSAIAFPFIQIIFLADRLGFIGLIIVFILLIEQLKHGTVLSTCNAVIVKFSLLFKSLWERIFTWQHKLQTKDNSSSDHQGSLQTFQLSYLTTIMICILLSAAGFILYWINSLYYLVPLLSFVPLCLFSPSGMKKYLIWPCLLIAALVAFKTADTNMYEVLVISFAYNYMIDKRSRRLQNMIVLFLLAIWGFILFGLENLFFLFFIMIAIAFASSRKFKWVRWVPAGFIVEWIIRAFTPGNRLFSLELLPMFIMAMFFLVPRKAKLVVTCAFLSSVAILIPQLIIAPKIHINVSLPETKRLTLNVGPASYRPMDYVETVINALETPGREKLGTGMMTIKKYFELTVIPYPMSFYYGYKMIQKTDIAGAVPIITGLLFILLVAVAFSGLKKWPVLSSALFIYTISLFPASNILTPIPGMVAERLLFIPSLGFCILLSWLLIKLSGIPNEKDQTRLSLKNLPALFKLVSVALLLIYSGVTVARNVQWHDSLTLMRHDITHLDESAQAHNLLATHLARKATESGNDSEARLLLLEAEAHFEKAISIYNKFFNAIYDLGRVRMMLGELDEAEYAFKKAIEVDSTFSEPFFHLASLRLNERDYESAIPYYEKYIRIMPGDLDALMNLSFCYAQMHNFNSALVYMKRAVNLFPNNTESLINLSKIFANMGQLDSALFYMRKAEIISPAHPDVKMLKDAFDRQSSGAD